MEITSRDINGTHGHAWPTSDRPGDRDGTPEIMKAIIARETFGREFAPYK